MTTKEILMKVPQHEKFVLVDMQSLKKYFKELIPSMNTELHALCWTNSRLLANKF